MSVTGLRIGEATAVTWDALDQETGTVEVRGTVVRIKGKGVSTRWKPKSRSGYRTLELSSWAPTMLRERRAAVPDADGQAPVFPAVMGGLRDPSNTQADLRDIVARAGPGWVTSHVCRTTVATLTDDAGLSARQAADQLGHSTISMTQVLHVGRKVAATGAKEVLEVVGTTSTPGAHECGFPGGSISGRCPGHVTDLGESSSDWTRTNNRPINSRVLCH